MDRLIGQLFRVAALSAFALVVGCQCQKKEVSLMPASPLDNVLDSQLVTPPPESLAVLDSIEKGTLPPPAGRAVSAASELVRGWCTTTLFRGPYRPNARVPFVAFASEAGRFDVVRARYTARMNVPPFQETRIEVASSRDVASIVVTLTPEESALGCGERVHRVAERILETSAPLDFVETGRSKGVVYGTPRDLAPPDATTPRHIFWERDLRWWCSPEKVGFILLKGDGGVSPVRISFAPEENRVWFAAYAWMDNRDR
jgi:hypothetical protein